MKRLTITELKQLFNSDELEDRYIKELKSSDERKGVQQLIRQYEQKKAKQRELEQHFLHMSRFEQTLYNKGCQYIAGIDEAGRGPLAGPVVAAAVILPRDFKLLGIDDSKKLSQKELTDKFTVIKREALSYGIGIADNHTIDQINIYEATKQAMYDAVSQLDPPPDYTLIDAVNLHEFLSRSKTIPKGDQESISIAAASILAKVTRDRLMNDIHKEYPAYGFCSNMGYGTKQHIHKLNELGATPYHRRSFSPVQKTISS